MRRLFFALWPDRRMREALSAAVHATMIALPGGRPVPVENLHVTLAFLGGVPEASLPALLELARNVAPRAEPMLLTLDTIDYWRRAQVLCAAASREPAGAAAFAEGLKSALCAAGFRPDLKPFRAHVTLARQVRRAPPDAAMPPVPWSFDEFALVESRTLAEGSSYSVLESWTLCGAARGGPEAASEQS
jgi:2'-5' RNA ligase